MKSSKNYPSAGGGRGTGAMVPQKPTGFYGTALWKAEMRIDDQELANNAHFNSTLVFMPKSPLFGVMKDLQRAFIAVLKETELPEGFSPPIATGGKRTKASQRNVETLLANLLAMLTDRKPTLSLSLSPNAYSHTKLTAGFINLVKLAAHRSRQLLALKKGFHDRANPKRSRLARIRPTRKFWSLCEAISTVVGEDDISSEPHDLINLRTAKARGQHIGDLVPRKKWQTSIDEATYERLGIVEASLRWFNLVLAEYKIKCHRGGKTLCLFPVLYTVYNGDFAHGGRFYTGRSGHHNLSKKERATIRFNGHRTTELDYNGLHIRMLYHLRGIDYPLESDPYGAVLKAMGLNAKAIFRRFPNIRDDLKVSLLALINDKASEKQMVARADRRLFRSWVSEQDTCDEEDSKTECETRIANWAKAGLLLDASRPSAKTVLNGFLKAHAPIKADFSSGRGLELQNIDAEIARCVMMEMMVRQQNRCIPCLPVHDSFITFVHFSGVLRNAMANAYGHTLRQLTGKRRPFVIPINGS